jgi:hypothetical protein
VDSTTARDGTPDTVIPFADSPPLARGKHLRFLVIQNLQTTGDALLVRWLRPILPLQLGPFEHLKVLALRAWNEVTPLIALVVQTFDAREILDCRTGDLPHCFQSDRIFGHNGIECIQVAALSAIQARVGRTNQHQQPRP